MTILSKNAIFRPKTELEAIARWSVNVSHEVDCAYFGNIGRNSGFFLLSIFLGSYLIAHLQKLSNSFMTVKLSICGTADLQKVQTCCGTRWSVGPGTVASSCATTTGARNQSLAGACGGGAASLMDAK